MEKKLSKGQQLQKELLIQSENISCVMKQEEVEQAERFCEDYKSFLHTAKTEREAVEKTISLARQAGYREFQPGMQYRPGDKIYRNNRGKAILLTTIGKQPLASGVRIVAAHIDAPRLDLKPRPLYEEAQLAFFKTHYYGGIKKYQWTAIPLALHGVVALAGGRKITITIGEDPGDPVFCVTDLLPHLADAQMKRTLAEGIKGEELNILIGSYAFRDDEASEKVKLNIMHLLHEKYGIIERDLLSAELEAVPAFAVRDVGLDRSMIGGYAHDDRVCAYTALRAELETAVPEHTTVTILTDKEETGSDGNTGLDSEYLRYYIEDLALCEDVCARDIFAKSGCLSADVNAAYDPTFGDVNDKRNASYLSYGAVITKYTGARGKYSTNDAHAEFVRFVTDMLDADGVLWQTGELGKVDHGGGGTVAKLIARYDVDTIDVGVPVLSMHAPFEIVSKLDVFMLYRAFRTFLK